MENLDEKKAANPFAGVWKVLSNRFVLTSALFIAWMLFFDSNSYLNMKKQQKQAEELSNQYHFYEKETVHLREKLQEIQQDPEELEEFAREQYFYKEKGEEIFMLEKTK